MLTPGVFASCLTGVRRGDFGRYGVQSITHLPIISKPFNFLKSVDLRTVGLDLGDVPSGFGWELVVWKPILEQSELKGDLGPNEVQTEVFEIVDDSSLSKGDFVSVLEEIGSHPVSETQPESSLVFEDRLDETFPRVAGIELDEESETPRENIQTNPIEKPQTGEGLRRKRIKTPMGRTNLPIVHKFLAMQSKTSSSPSQQKSATPKPTRKSYRLTSQSIHKKTSSSKQSPLS